MLNSARYRDGGTAQGSSVLLDDRLASGERGVCSADTQGMTLEKAERWLAPILGYDPDQERKSAVG